MNSLSVGGKSWISKKFNSEEINFFKTNFFLDEIIAKLLSIRKIKKEEVSFFLEPLIKNILPNPYILKDMDIAIERTEKAITEASKGEGSIAKVVTPVLELGLGAQLTAPIALGKTFGGDFSDDNIYDLLGITKSYRAGYGVKAKKNGGMTKTQMRRLYPELYKEYYPPKSDEVKEYEKYQKQMYKDFYGQD